VRPSDVTEDTPLPPIIAAIMRISSIWKAAGHRRKRRLPLIYICKNQNLVQSPGVHTHQQPRIYQKALFAARDLSQAVENLAYAVLKGSVKVSDPRNKYLLRRVVSPNVSRLLHALERKKQPDRSPEVGGPDPALDQWWQQVAPLIDQLPYFGQDIVPVPRRLPKRKRGQALGFEGHQQLLLSWLAGGSAREKAERIGVSHRSIYTWLSKIIYTPNPDKLLEYWFSLGLVAVLAVPVCPKAGDTRWPQVVCLICHHLLCPYPRQPHNTLPLQVVKADPQRHLPSAELWEVATEVQGHLILHYEVGEEPIHKPLSESIWSQVHFPTQKSIDYWAELGGCPNAPGGAPTPPDLMDWEKWRKGVLAGGKIPPPQATVLNSHHRLHATPGSEERRW